MAHGYSIDTVRVPLYRFILFSPGHIGGRTLRQSQVDYMALSDVSTGVSSVAENDLQTATVPTISQGDELLIVAGGAYSLVAGTLSLRLKVGGTTISTISGFSVNSGAGWAMTAHIVCRGSALVYTVELRSTALATSSSSVNNHRLESNTSSPSLTTPVVKMTEQFSSSDAGHNVTQSLFTIFRYRK